MQLVLVCTSFVAAALLFCLEPMVGKMLLPLLGGSPAVWSTCIAFFQAALLAGYAYAHATLSWFGARKQAALHVVVVALVLLALPLHIGEMDVARWPTEANPALRLLALLATRVGPPFVIVAATGPLLQRWLSATSLREARDPYFLYAASNLGSLLALVAYPVVIELSLGLCTQTRAWRWGYTGFAALTSLSAVLAARGAGESAVTPVATKERVSGAVRLRWMVLAAVPSALLLGVTTYLSTEIASFPLLWVLPLVTYLLTFVLAFAPRRVLSTRMASRLLPLPTAAVFIVVLSEAYCPAWASFILHLGMLFLASMVCHGRLADDRPHPEHLTSFYLSLSAGGALGGAIAAFLAPVLFDRLVEYPLEMLAACFLRPAPRDAPDAAGIGRADIGWALGIGALATAMVLTVSGLRLSAGRLAIGLTFGVPMLVHYRSLVRPGRFALGLSSLVAVSYLFPNSPFGRTLHNERSFFGILRVTVSADGLFRQIVHGSTVHGRQIIDPAARREPSAYYHRAGPLGQIFANAVDVTPVNSAAVIGLGCGTIAAYARPGEKWTFYEIDPAVERIARDVRFFTYLADAFPDGRALHVELGDARLRLHDAPDGAFDILILDAFSSDSIPVHLLVREAVTLYLRKLAADGLLVLHISNRYLDLEPVVAALARDAGLVAACRTDAEEDADPGGKVPSQWCAVARRVGRLGALATSAQWSRPRENGKSVWTDDRSSLVEALR
jgi:hypothetical protein